MKKFLSVILSLIMLVSLVACLPQSDEAKAKAAVNDFLGAITTFNLDEAENYVSDPSVIPEEIRGFDVDSIMETLPAEFEPYADDFEDLINSMIDKFSEMFSYEITEVTPDENNYIVTVKIKYPDFENSNFEAIVDEMLTGEDYQALISELLGSGEIDLTSTQEEVIDALLPRLISMLQTAVDNLEITAIETEGYLAVTNVNGRWLIDASLSEF